MKPQRRLPAERCRGPLGRGRAAAVTGLGAGLASASRPPRPPLPRVDSPSIPGGGRGRGLRLRTAAHVRSPSRRSGFQETCSARHAICFQGNPGACGQSRAEPGWFPCAPCHGGRGPQRLPTHGQRAGGERPGERPWTPPRSHPHAPLGTRPATSWAAVWPQRGVSCLGSAGEGSQHLRVLARGCREPSTLMCPQRRSWDRARARPSLRPRATIVRAPSVESQRASRGFRRRSGGAASTLGLVLS